MTSENTEGAQRRSPITDFSGKALLATKKRKRDFFICFLLSFLCLFVAKDLSGRAQAFDDFVAEGAGVGFDGGFVEG